MKSTTQRASNNRNQVAAALRTTFNILEVWGVKVKDWGGLLGVSEATVHRWKASPNSAGHSKDLVERLSYILGIFKALQILLPDTAAADSWINRPNTAAMFGGRTPLERLMGGNMADLYNVRRWLDGQRGTA